MHARALQVDMMCMRRIFSQKNDSIKRYTCNQSLLQNIGCCKWGSTDGRADSDTFSQVYNQLYNAIKLIFSHMHKWLFF